MSLILEELKFTYVDNLIISFGSDVQQTDIDSIWADVGNEKVHFLIALVFVDFSEK